MDKPHFIINQASHLPLPERKAVVKAIIDTIDRDALAMDAGERFAQLVPKAEVAVEWKYNPTRKTNGDAYIRNLVAKVMRTEGYTFAAIGDAMGRHYSSVITMCHRADAMRDGYFGSTWQKRYNDFIESL